MLDIRYVRDNQEAVAQAMANRNFPWDAELFASLDEQRRGRSSRQRERLAEANAWLPLLRSLPWLPHASLSPP